MKIFLSIIFILLLGLITLHDANSSEISLVGYSTPIADGISDAVVHVRTVDGVLFDVSHLRQTAVGLGRMNSIPTAQGAELVRSEIQTYFYGASSKFSTDPAVVTKIPDIGF